MSKRSKLKLLPALALFLCIGFHADAQVIRYSRQTLPLPVYDNMHLIPEVSGNYHLLFYKHNYPITLYSFNKELQSLGKKELPIKFRDTCDTRIIPFKNFYLLYFHKRGSATHELWKIHANGQASSLTGLFQRFIEASFKKSTSTLQLVNQDEELVVIAHTYYEELKVLTSVIIKVDESFKSVSSCNFSYPFDREADILSQVMLLDETLFILQTMWKTDNYALQLIKADLNTGKLLRKTFDSKSNFTRGAAFRYIPEEQGIIIHSNVGRQLFICKLDTALNEMVPSTLIAHRPGNNVPNNFLFLDGKEQQWLAANLSGTPRPSTGGSFGRTNDVRQLSDISPNWTNIGFYTDGTFNSLMISQSSASLGFSTSSLPAGGGPYMGDASVPVGFLVADEHFKLRNDSIVSNKKGPSTLIGTEYATVLVGDRSCLILKQDFSRKDKGLLLLSVSRDSKISTREISVNGKFQYFLKDAQTTRKTTLVIPYVHKDEVGLVKLSFAGVGE